ncbi:unnamed protein product [Ostreobium quekettii]|uniref:Hemimethylated DNA-binding domain-containing protein n=1 Tax=Ostreobium quekettii TaxID=121088 RepID=A0A8S1JCI8_9CHLO|nr:unnamed protein product [Ostreobium quekettii]|eukprot:evm.model.scf_855.3 EVM.evm.TU.scf_855.3   scf_855:38852-42880(-)
MASRGLALACYRAILRWGEAARGTPFRIKRDHLAELSPALAEAYVAVHDVDTLRSVARWAFKEHREAKDAEEQQAIASALEAVRLLNAEYSPLVKDLQDRRLANTDRKGVTFRVGDVVENIKEGYHGIVLGWDRVCKKPAMVKYKNLRFDQPFYSILPDQHDSVRAYGMPRVYAYVAQEHVQRSAKPKQIASCNMGNYFEAYSGLQGRYIPRYSLRFEYPDDYEAHDAVPLEGGTDIADQGKKARPKKKSLSTGLATGRAPRRAKKAVMEEKVAP